MVYHWSFHGKSCIPQQSHYSDALHVVIAVITMQSKSCRPSKLIYAPVISASRRAILQTSARISFLCRAQINFADWSMIRYDVYARCVEVRPPMQRIADRTRNEVRYRTLASFADTYSWLNSFNGTFRYSFHSFVKSRKYFFYTECIHSFIHSFIHYIHSLYFNKQQSKRCWVQNDSKSY